MVATAARPAVPSLLMVTSAAMRDSRRMSSRRTQGPCGGGVSAARAQLRWVRACRRRRRRRNRRSRVARPRAAGAASRRLAGGISLARRAAVRPPRRCAVRIQKAAAPAFSALRRRVEPPPAYPPSWQHVADTSWKSQPLDSVRPQEQKTSGQIISSVYQHTSSHISSAVCRQSAPLCSHNDVMLP